MIDFHMLVTRDLNTFETNSAYLVSCNETLRQIDNRGHSVLYGRTKAYSETDSELVSFIDDDDYTMLTAKHLEVIKLMNKDALFTNSLFKAYKAWMPLCNTRVIKYKKSYEDQSMLCPHQTIVLRRTLALDLLKEAGKLIKENNWCENTTDYVLRNLVSSREIWTYYPEITYKRVNQNKGLHTTQVEVNREIRNYFKHLKSS